VKYQYKKKKTSSSHYQTHSIRWCLEWWSKEHSACPRKSYIINTKKHPAAIHFRRVLLDGILFVLDWLLVSGRRYCPKNMALIPLLVTDDFSNGLRWVYSRNKVWVIDYWKYTMTFMVSNGSGSSRLIAVSISKHHWVGSTRQAVILLTEQS
jgi:hypothetical protein